MINAKQAAIALHPPLLDLVDKLADMMPAPDLDSFLFVTTGAEAVENAVKLARMATGRNNIIVMDVSSGRPVYTLSWKRDPKMCKATSGQHTKSEIIHRQ